MDWSERPDFNAILLALEVTSFTQSTEIQLITYTKNLIVHFAIKAFFFLYYRSTLDSLHNSATYNTLCSEEWSCTA